MILKVAKDDYQEAVEDLFEVALPFWLAELKVDNCDAALDTARANLDAANAALDEAQSALEQCQSCQ